MTDRTKSNGSETDTTALSLGKFVQAQSTPSMPAEDGGNEHPTIFFVKAAAEICHQSRKPVVNPKDTGPLPPAAMLGIVSYCYAKGVYAAEDIERKLITNPTVRAACANEVPTAGAIRRFRRFNREAILATLEKFYRRIRSFSGAGVPHGPEGEARHSLEKATFIDGMSR